MTATARVMVWNICEGLGGSAGAVDPYRLELMRATVAAADPDVLVLNEALWCQPYKNQFIDYASLLGFAHSYGRLYYGAWGNIVLGKSPLKHCHSYQIYNRGGLRCHIGEPEHPLTIATYHPHPSRWPHHKAEDFGGLLCGVDGACLVAGDFNAISPDDKVHTATLAPSFARFSAAPYADAARFVDGGVAVFAQLHALGFRDAFAPEERHFTIPTDFLSSDKNSAMRIDHAWVNQNVVHTRGQVLVSSETQQASDHFPLLIEVGW